MLSESEERAYIQGRDASLRRMLMHCARELAVFAEGSDPLVKLAALTDERARVAKALRDVCRRLGCDEWPDDLDLADVVEKHLGRAVSELVEDE